MAQKKMKVKEVIAERYQVERVLGEGGMGVTLLAIDQLLGRRVVIKRPKQTELNDWFAKEAKAQAVLNHTNVVKVFDYGFDAHRQPFLVMEWIAGWDLHRLIERARSLSPDRATYLIRAIAQAVTHLHVFGLIHRDIKPQNILIGSDDIPRLADFGLAKLPSYPLTSAGQGMGTPLFGAPEQFKDAKNVDARADIYSLGMTLLAMLTGRPFPEDRSLISTVPSEFREALYRCLEYKPKDRFPSVEAFLEALPRRNRPEHPDANMVGTPQALKTIKLSRGVPVHKKDHVELLFHLGEVRLSGKGNTRTILGYCYLPDQKAAYVIRMHEEKKFDVKRATKAIAEYSPSVGVDEEVVASLVSLEDAAS
jgi:serine/threonine-protein kinase